jgi:GTPase SAR1 family protein
MKIERTKEFDLAYRFATETNQNIFLTGKAGTGKTTFLKYLRQNSIKKTVVAAPTGVAAINANGVTLHSLFQLPFGVILPDTNFLHSPESSFINHPLISKIHFSSEKLNLLRNIELLIIDEASMLASYILDAIDAILRYVRRNPESPFGGVQLLLIGDLHQLPPVVKRDDWEILQEYYSSIFFFDSFVLRDNQPVKIELIEIYRQKDEKFIEILNGIRNNDISEENFHVLNSRLKRNFLPRDNEGYITLTTHNFQSDEINRKKLNKLQAPSEIYQADINGDFSENIFPAEAELELKVGAQVMFLKNDTEGKKYFNGKIGVITYLNGDTIRVKCKEDFEEIVVKQTEWQNIRYILDSETRELREEIIGTFRQFPLRLAWAITIHKSQGLTFERAVIDAEKAFAIGQVYVALSRCTCLEGLVLSSPVYRNFLGEHQDLRDWQKKNHFQNLAQLFIESRQNYILEELQNIFTWKKWHYELKALNEFLWENRIKISSEALTWVSNLIEKQKALSETAEKFRQTIVQLNKNSVHVENNDNLQKRIKDGAAYFYDEISKWNVLFTNHPLSVETKKLSRKIDRWLEEISLVVQEILFKISFCKNGFLLEDYLKSRKFINPHAKIIGSYSKDESPSPIDENISNKELYHRLIELRTQIRKGTSLPNYLIFNNTAIKNLCEYLPLTKEDLLKVKGFKQTKVDYYGDKIISIVQEYCRLHNIEPPQKVVTDKTESTYSVKSNSVLETVRLLRERKNIEEIAKERALVPGTIESHLAQAISQNLIQIEEIMTMDEAKKIAEYFPKDLNDVRLASIKEKVHEDVTYGKLRMVLAWLQK